ncbi:MAG: alkene reductase [Gammaproteobacteria bacterium]
MTTGSSINLFTPLKLGTLELPNRVIMAPLTRARAGASHIPNDVMVEYYAQRASSGLIISEASMVDAHGCAFIGEGGIYNDAQVAGWKRVTDAVHAKGGRMFMQLWHPGRAAHSLLNAGEQPVCSSARPIANGDIQTPEGAKPYQVPRALRLDEMPRYVEMFRLAAQNARAAGFDGVQIHGAHGYLIDSFLRDGVNDRTDAYGGSIENRARFLLEVTDAVIGVWGAGRVGVRISPLVRFNDMVDSQPAELVAHVASQLNRRRIGFLEIRHEDHSLPEEQVLARIAREHFDGVLLGNGGYDYQTGQDAVASGWADAIVFGGLYIANPDLVERFAGKAPLNAVDYARIYGVGREGYCDYPMLADLVADAGEMV